MSNGWMSAAPRTACRTLLLPVPRDCGQLPACPRKSLRDSIAAAFQRLWKITTHIWHWASPLMTLFQHQRMWPFSGVCWAQVASQSLPNVLPAVEPLFPVWPENLRTPLCSWGFALPTRAPPGIELRSCSLCAPLVYSLNGTSTLFFLLSPFLV